MTQKLITRFQTEALPAADLQSKFAHLQEILIRTQAAQLGRSIALASMATVQAERNRRMSRNERWPSSLLGCRRCAL